MRLYTQPYARSPQRAHAVAAHHLGRGAHRRRTVCVAGCRAGDRVRRGIATGSPGRRHGGEVSAAALSHGSVSSGIGHLQPVSEPGTRHALPVVTGSEDAAGTSRLRGGLSHCEAEECQALAPVDRHRDFGRNYPGDLSSAAAASPAIATSARTRRRPVPCPLPPNVPGPIALYTGGDGCGCSRGGDPHLGEATPPPEWQPWTRPAMAGQSPRLPLIAPGPLRKYRCRSTGFRPPAPPSSTAACAPAWPECRPAPHT